MISRHGLGVRSKRPEGKDLVEAITDGPLRENVKEDALKRPLLGRSLFLTAAVLRVIVTCFNPHFAGPGVEHEHT